MIAMGSLAGKVSSSAASNRASSLLGELGETGRCFSPRRSLLDGPPIDDVPPGDMSLLLSILNSEILITRGTSALTRLHIRTRVNRAPAFAGTPFS